MKAIFIATVCLATASLALAQDQLSAARDLYASASYEEALTALTQLHEENPAGPISARVDQYRAFCLFALGRTTEARSVAEALITSNPLLDLESDASPRITAMFTDVRKRLLPTLVREQYRAARAAMEKKDFAAAEPQLVKVRQLLDEAATAGISDETLTDMGVLVEGFLDIARNGMTRVANDSARGLAPASGDVAPANRSAGSPAPIANTEPQIFDSTTQGVTAPVVIHQEFPPVPGEISRLIQRDGRSGLLEVIIGESGNVERAVMRESVFPLYDNLLVMAARSWKYQPAVKGTTRVKYVKVIAVNIKRDLPPLRPQP